MQTLTKDEKHSAKLLVKNLNIEFDSRNFENPTIQKFYSGLQALALKEENPAPVQNLLDPDYEGLAQFQPVIDRFKDVFYDGEKEDPAIAKKPARGGGRGRGRGASANQSSDPSVADVKGRGAAGKGRGKKVEAGSPKPEKNKKRKTVKNTSQESDKASQGQSKPVEISQVSRNGSSSRVTAPQGGDLEKKVKEAYEQENLTSLKVSELKDFLKLKELPYAGVKTFLIGLVTEYYEN